jgi:hypothetical protein
MAHFLNRNHGLIGEEFVRGIMENGGPVTLFAKAMEAFKQRYDFSFLGKERYWQSAMVIAYLTGRLMKKLGLGVVDYDACIRAGLDSIKALRRELSDEKLDCFDALGLYMGEHASKTVVFRHNAGKAEGTVMAPYPYDPVARIEAKCTNTTDFVSGRLFINQVHFNEWCHERGLDRKSLVAQLQIHGVKVHKDRRIALTRGTDKPLPAVRVFEIELVHQRFVSIMKQSDLGIVNTGQIALVKDEAA